jgi:hypothetical protein
MELKLPSSVIGWADIARLQRETELVQNSVLQNRITGEAPATMPAVSQPLADIARLNNLDISQKSGLEQLGQLLKQLKDKAPTIHMSFATVPAAAFTAKIIEWLRANIHPSVLLDIGLQPTIAAGCVIRTTNKYIDCSMRQHLLTNRPKLITMLKDIQT